MSRKRVFCSGSSKFEQRGGRVTEVLRGAAHLVDLVPDHHGVADLGFPQPANDPARRGDRKLIGTPRMADSSQRPPKPTVTAGRRRARATSLARDVSPQPGGSVKHRIGARVAVRAGRTTRRRAATEAEPSPRQDRAPRARPSRVRAVDLSWRLAGNRRMRALISGPRGPFPAPPSPP